MIADNPLEKNLNIFGRLLGNSSFFSRGWFQNGQTDGLVTLARNQIQGVWFHLFVTREPEGALQRVFVLEATGRSHQVVRSSWLLQTDVCAGARKK